MNKGIVITTHEKTFPFLIDLLESLQGCPYPIIVKKNTDYDNGWELAGIKLGSLVFDEFLYLQDTVLIKDKSIITRILSYALHGISVSVFPEFNSYIGKYLSSILKNMDIPVVKTKLEAIDYERKFTREYMKNCGHIHTMFPDIDAWKPSKVFIEKHGRNNCVYENEYFIKYKGTWSKEMVK